MSIVEKYADFVNTEGIISLFDKYQKSLGDNRSLAANECDITPKSVYDWENLKENVKHSTKVKVLEKIIEDLPVETFSYLTHKLFDSSTETLMSCLTTLYEMSFDAKDEKEYLTCVNEFENTSRKYAGLIYKHRDLEVNHMFSKLSGYAKSQNYHWNPHQTILYDSEMVKQMIPQIISSWVYYGLPISAEELSARTKFPLDIVSTVGNELNQQLLSLPTSTTGEIASPLTSTTADITRIDEGIHAGLWIEGTGKTMISTAGTLKRSKITSSLEDKTS